MKGSRSKNDGGKGLGARILKWVGIVTALISLVLGVRQVVKIVKENAEESAKVSALRTEAERLTASGEHSQAWTRISEAVELDSDLRGAQLDIAMDWLRNARIGSTRGERSFAEIVEKVLPVLHRAIDTTRRDFSATVLAHIGYANYLLYKEGDRNVRVDDHLKDALRLDPTNHYAHAMYGHWILFPGHGKRSLEEATAHFDAALRSGKDIPYVRTLMLAAFRNASGPEYSAQLIKTANDMRTNGETIALSYRQWILSDAYFMHRREIMDLVGKFLTPEEHLATFLYLADGVDINEKTYLKDALTSLRNATQR